MNEEVKVVYEGVEIKYDERENRWRFELRGRERSADTLAKAKEFIDKPAPEGEKVKFEKVPVLIQQSYKSGTFIRATVTSIAEKRYGSQEVWIVREDKTRSKTSQDLYLDTPENAAIVDRVKELRRQQDEIDNLIVEQQGKLAKYKVPA